MNITKKIYFLSAIVLIIGCYALNLSYSLFVQTEEKEVVSSTVPTIETSLSVTNVTLEPNKEYLLKQTITNNSEVKMHYALNTKSSNNVIIKMLDIEENSSIGLLEENSSKDIYMYISNPTETDSNISFVLLDKYATLNNDLTTNIDNEEKYTINYENRFIENTNTLVYSILNNNTKSIKDNNLFINKNLIELPIKIGEVESIIGKETSLETEHVLSETIDDYGTSYFFRGNVENNYVDFANMCWRIVRIDGNGNIKLILEDQDNNCASSNGNWDISNANYGYELAENNITINYLEPITDKEKSINNKLQDFSNNKLNEHRDKLISDWCLNDMTIINEEEQLTSLKCNGEKINNTNVGLLTVDEVLYAGGMFDKENTKYYLINPNQMENKLSYWTITKDSDSNTVLYVSFEGKLMKDNSNSVHNIRPSIILDSKTEIVSGNGTKPNSYIIK